MHATVQVKKRSSTGGANQSAHILRESERYESMKNELPNIILKKPVEKFEQHPKGDARFSKEELATDKERQKELKKVNASISTYKKRISQTDDPKRLERLQKKLDEYLEKREELKGDKQIEKRGRKQRNNYIEYVFNLTGATTRNQQANAQFAKAVHSFVQDDFFKGMELTTGAVHLDQSSLHAHVLFKLPEGKTWERYAKQFRNDVREVYKVISQQWEKHIKRSGIAQILGEKLEENKEGGRRFYFPLRKYKELTGFKYSENNQNKAREAILNENEGKSSSKAFTNEYEHLYSEIPDTDADTQTTQSKKHRR